MTILRAAFIAPGRAQVIKGAVLIVGGPEPRKAQVALAPKRAPEDFRVMRAKLIVSRAWSAFPRLPSGAWSTKTVRLVCQGL